MVEILVMYYREIGDRPRFFNYDGNFLKLWGTW